MSNITNENRFESAIIQSLIDNGGYELGNSLDYDSKTGLFKEDILNFLRDTQSKNWDNISGIKRTK